jgi:hypothetical protein
MVFLLVSTAGAYTLKNAGTKEKPVVQLYFVDKEAKSLSGSGANAAADNVLAYAKTKGLKIQRSKDSVVGEIRAHALAWMTGITKLKNHANPMDIEMYKAEWWTYILD